MDNEVMELIDQLYTMVSEAWGVPLGNEKCIVERDQVLEILDEIKTAMPAELSEAKRLVSARDEFINNAKREAEALRKSAEEQARAMIEEQEVIRTARAKSAEMISAAEAKSSQLRRVASEYVDNIMRQTEESMNAALATIQNAHNSFRSLGGGQPQEPKENAVKLTGVETIQRGEEE